MLLEARGDGPEVLELTEEAFDEIAVAIEECTERWLLSAPGDRLDVRPRAARRKALAQSVAVVGAISEQDLTAFERLDQIDGAPPIVRLAFGEFEADRQAIGVHERMDFGGQSASRAPHASACSDVPSGGLRFVQTPFLTLAAC